LSDKTHFLSILSADENHKTQGAAAAVAAAAAMTTRK